MVAVVGTGLGVGVATAVLQQHLGPPWFSLVNAASPWLTPMFVLGALFRHRRSAALAGLAAGLLELVGYYATASARGYPYLGGRLVLFWIACALIGGPVFGLAGRAWWRGRSLRGLGGAVLPAAWLAEAVVVFGLRLGYEKSAGLFVAIGLVIAVLVGVHGRMHGQLVGWLLVTFPLGVVSELLLSIAYRQAT